MEKRYYLWSDFIIKLMEVMMIIIGLLSRSNELMTLLTLLGKPLVIIQNGFEGLVSEKSKVLIY